MAVKRNAMAQALAKPQGISVQRVAPVATTSQYSNPNAQLAYGQGLVNKAVSGQGFDPQGGWGVAAAQIATAGIGAWAQNRARKEIAEKEVASQQAFAQSYPEYANMASQLSPETRQAYSVAKMSNDLKVQDPATQLGLQKTQAEIGKLNAEAGKARREASNVGTADPEKTFNNSTALRKDYLNDSKNFKSAKDGYERVITSGKNPSAAGDISLIFGYMKTLDPTSTVREGEFATAESARGLPESVVAKYNKVLKGERLAPEQRADFLDRATKLYTQAEKSQNKVADQYRKIAVRNRLNPEDVVVDFSTTIPTTPPKGGQTPIPNLSGNINGVKWSLQ